MLETLFAGDKFKIWDVSDRFYNEKVTNITILPSTS